MKTSGTTASAAVAEAPLQPGRRYVLRSQVAPDPNQPRKEFNAQRIAELADSFGGSAEGILETLKVRAAGESSFVLIDGERRWRAAGLAKIERVPIEVIAPKDVLKTQLIFGTQRENLTALEEALACQQLLEERKKGDPKFNVADLGREVGRERSSMYELLRLNKLSPHVRKALASGEIDLTKAQLFGQVPPEQHPALLKRVTQVDRWSEAAMSVDKLKKLINEEYSRQLSAAGWKWDDASLVKKAGPCSTCPRRSGNIEGLAGNPNVCTDVVCYEVKQEAHTARTLAEAAEVGKRVVDAKLYERTHYDFATPDEKPYRDPKRRTWGQLAKVANLAPAVTVNDAGKAIEVFTAADKEKILAANKIQQSSGGLSAAERKAQAALTKKKKEFDEKAKLATGKILETLVTAKGIDARLWVLLSDAVASEAGIERTAFVAKRLKIAKTQNEANEALEAWLTSKERTDVDRMRFIVEVLLCARWIGGGWGKVDWRDEFVEVCKLAGGTPEKLAEKGFADWADEAVEGHRKLVDALQGKKKKAKKK